MSQIIDNSNCIYELNGVVANRIDIHDSILYIYFNYFAREFVTRDINLYSKLCFGQKVNIKYTLLDSKSGKLLSVINF